MNYTHPHYLTQPAELAAWLDEAPDDLRIYDCTVFLHPDPPRYRVESGAARYHEGHIPGAGFLDLTGSLSDTDSPYGFTLPAPDILGAALGAAGVGDTSRVVLYSTGHVMWATRVWWMLHSHGHRNVSVLDGGLRSWQEAGLPVSTEPCTYPAATFSPALDAVRWADTDAVLAAIGDGSVCTLNALGEEVHSGEGPLNYGRKGHIAGSRNVPFETLLDRGRFRDAAAVAASLDAKGVLDAERVICYCGGGISATIDAFALSLLGHPNVAVYDGSMSEWSSNPELPMENGRDDG